MDRETARTLAVAAIKGSSLLTSVLPALKEKCAPAEYAELRAAVSTVAADISINVLRRVFRAYPDLEGELDAAIQGGKPLD